MRSSTLSEQQYISVLAMSYWPQCGTVIPCAIIYNESSFPFLERWDHGDQCTTSGSSGVPKRFYLEWIQVSLHLGLRSCSNSACAAAAVVPGKSKVTEPSKHSLFMLHEKALQLMLKLQSLWSHLMRTTYFFSSSASCIFNKKLCYEKLFAQRVSSLLTCCNPHRT